MIEPIVHKVNFRVEVVWRENQHRYVTGDAQDALSIADLVNNLKGVQAEVIYDLEYECPNCHFRRPRKKDLEGCCEENPASEGGP